MTEYFSFQNLTTDTLSLVIYVAPHGMYVQLRSSCASTLYSVLQVTGSIPGLGIQCKIVDILQNEVGPIKFHSTVFLPALFTDDLLEQML